MKNRTLFFRLCASVLFLAVSGCSYVKRYQEHTAYARYQQALGTGDLKLARNALLQLVHVDQDVPDYWLELGKLQLQLADYSGAYDAFAHAHELDRTNVEVLSTMAQIALLSGNVDMANEHAQSLSLIAPGNPVVTTVKGYVALKAGEFQKAEEAADTVLTQSPNDTFAVILKSRVLISEKKFDEAIALLEDQHRVVPQDRSAIKALSDLYRLRDDWRNVARIQADAHQLDPKNNDVTLKAIEAFLRANDIAAASQLSRPLLSASADSQVLDRVLNLWARFAPNPLPDAEALAKSASDDGRVSFANYFNMMHQSAEAAALLKTERLPVTHINARWNAVLAQALALEGKSQDANRLFDLVLDREPDQVDALRGRAALETQSGASRRAVIDAERLVTISPDSAEDRLILARAYLVAGNRNEVRRTLWDAFQALPDDERIFSALKSVLVSTGDADGQRRLTDEFNDGRTARLMKELV